MNKLNFDKIVSFENLLKIDEKDKNTLFTIANIELNKLNSSSVNDIISYNNKDLRVRQIVKIGIYNNFPTDHKEIICSYIMYDTEKFIKTLVKVNINFETIQALVNKIEELKNIYTLNRNDKIFENENTNKIIAIVNKICFLIKKELNGQDDYIIINKLICIVAFEKDLYLKIQNNKTKTQN